MGASLVALALLHRDLPDRTRLVLVAMALVALDTDRKGQEAAVYWGGWDHLAQVLGYPDARTGTAGHKAVTRALATLQDRGLVKPVKVRGGGPGHQEYRLTLL